MGYPPARYNLSEEESRRTASFLAAGRMPAPLEHGIEEYIARKTGKPYDDPVILERLRRSITAQKDDYWKAPAKRRLAYTKGYSVLSYLAYHFPVYFLQTEYLLQELAGAGLLRPAISVLDIGTGPGVVPLAVADFYSRLDGASATVWSVEQSEEHTEAFRWLLNSASPQMRNSTIHPPLQADISTIRDDQIPGPADLLVFSNVINEFEAGTVAGQADLVMKFAGHVAQDGSILIVEPAEEVTATRLRILTQELQGRGLTVHSPCTFIRSTRCDPSRCWSFTTQPAIRPTRLMEFLARGNEPYRYINTDIKYAYVVLRKDSYTKHPFRVPRQAKVARLSKLHLHLNRTINVIASRMSQDLGDQKTHVIRLCDGTAAKPVYAVIPAYHLTPGNSTLLNAPYGAILELHSVQVRYNPKHDSFNILVNRNSTVRVTG